MHLTHKQHPAHESRIGNGNIDGRNSIEGRLFHQLGGIDHYIPGEYMDTACTVQIKSASQEIIDALSVFPVFDRTDLKIVLLKKGSDPFKV